MLVSDVTWLEGLLSLLEGGEREDRRLKVPLIRDVTELDNLACNMGPAE